MSILRQLKWRIIGAHMSVVIVGVSLVLLTANIITKNIVPSDVEAELLRLVEASDSQDTTAVEASLLNTFRRSIITTVSVAALGAIIVGIGTSLLLVREILNPLRQLAESSQRIARGHYGERVNPPASDELTMVADSFNQMAETLEHMEDQRITLIGNVSHELRTPLTGLEGYLEGLMDGLFSPDEETFAPMYQEARRLRRLVDDLQALSRVEAGQISLHQEEFDLIPLLKRVVIQLHPQASNQSLKLITETGESPVFVYADPDRTAQVLLNLVGNAMRYTPEEGQITVSIATNQNYAHITVQDTGIGIPSEALPFIFERFYRVDASRTRQSGGSGIGLTISRHLVWMMGGELMAASEGLGKGSSFSFTLPLSQQ